MAPPRRKRYRGTHPRRFDEKYKELAPERHPGEVAKVIARGQTPAGSHLPVMLPQVIEALRPSPGGIAIDCTLGHGGHAEAIAARIAPEGLLLGLDLDGEALAGTARRLGAKGIGIRTHHMSFAGIGKALRAEGLESADLVLADLGASSMQIDDPARGFSFKRDGPLDMRMDRSRGATAAEWLAAVGEGELAQWLASAGEEADAPRIATTVHAAAAARLVKTTKDLVRIVLEAKGLAPRHRRASSFDLHPAARTFQAIRTAVNREEEGLRQLLRVLPYVLRPSGRVAIICFHSGEEQVVAKAFAEGAAAGLYGRAPGQPLRPTRREVQQNPRARSARLHWAERSSRL